jgi:hypothetical protein
MVSARRSAPRPACTPIPKPLVVVTGAPSIEQVEKA